MFRIDLMSRTPVYEQIIEQLENFVLTGAMKSGDKLPSVRSLSLSLSINPNTIQKAYSELDTKGIICSVPGKGSFITEKALIILKKNKLSQLSDFENLSENLILAGISKDDIIDCVEKVYKRSRKI